NSSRSRLEIGNWKLEIGENGNEFTSWQKRYQIWSGTILIKETKRLENTVGYQIIRSSDSIAANIAEGYGRYTPEYKSIKTNVPISTFREWLQKIFSL
ncbi:MAG: four helix bundle protein, partial [Thermodesulfobacteriota bacterium]|nr:four helix bundle protein [Thermodesulfobacteriota bacterium]